MKNVKLKVRKLLDGIIKDTTMVEYFAEMVHHCIKNNIHEFDVVVQKDLYPVLAKKFKKSAGAIETEMVTVLRIEWRTMDLDLYKERFNYGNKVTVKKLLMLLLTKVKSDEK